MAADPRPRSVQSPSTVPTAGNDRAWPTLAALLAPAAGCDCQMLAVSLADRDPAFARRGKVAER